MIQLIGPGGAGKSTVGAVLALRLGCPFHDLDREFECRRADIDTFIDVHGYAAYTRENVAVYLDLIAHLGRPFCRRDAAAEDAVIRERFGRYLALPAPKVETMRPPNEVAAAIHARLAANASEVLPAERRNAGHRGAAL